MAVSDSSSVLDNLSLREEALKSPNLGSQHPSPNVKTPCSFEPKIWLEIITSRDAKSACFKGSKTSCLKQFSALFSAIFDEGQITHLICARLKYDLYDFFRGCFGPASCSFLVEKAQEHPLKKVI